MFSGSTPIIPRCPMVRKDKAASLLSARWCCRLWGIDRRPSATAYETAHSLTGPDGEKTGAEPDRGVSSTGTRQIRLQTASPSCGRFPGALTAPGAGWRSRGPPGGDHRTGRTHPLRAVADRCGICHTVSGQVSARGVRGGARRIPREAPESPLAAL
ncbi:hypothetical protein Stsp01_59420 [Streptomyces sp. NBRC 13847]|nr:hypothetical protein Stsp01_59420 [Streptomyces sp. NBRC 13847]